MTDRLNAHDPATVARFHVLPDSIHTSLLDWLDEFFAALSEANESQFREWESLRTSIESLLSLDASCSSAHRLRPFVQVWSSLSRILAFLKDMVREYLSALTTLTPRDATSASERAQEYLTAAGEENEALNAYLQRFQLLGESDDSKEAFDRLIGHALNDAAAADVIELDAAGQDFLTSLGIQEASAGMGIVVLLGATEATYLFNEERFWEAVSDSYATLLANPERIERLTHEVGWREDLTRATEKQQDAFAVYGPALARAERTRHQVRALLDIALALFEGPSKTYVATLLALQGVASYENLKRRDAGGLIHLASQHGLGPLLAGVSKSLRSARAHEDFAVLGNEVIIGEGLRRKQMHIDHLVDAVLEGVESVNALTLAHILLASHLDLDDVIQSAISLAELPWTDWVHLTARFAGWNDVAVEVRNDQLMVIGSPSARSPDVHVVTMLIPHIPGTCKTAALAWSDKEGRHIMQGPLEPLRLWRATEEGQGKLDFIVEAQRTWTRDGSSFISGDQVRKWIAVGLSQRLNSLADLVPRGRELKRLATRLGDEEALETIDAVIGAARGHAMGLDPTTSQSAGAIRVSEWLRLPAI